MDAVYSALDQMDTLAKESLSSGLVGRAKNLALGGLNKYAQTEWGQKLNLYDSYRDTAITAVKALAGGAGSGLRINTAEIAANVANLPSSSDNLEQAVTRIKQMKFLLDTQLSTTFPYIKEGSGGSTGGAKSDPLGIL